MPRILLTYQKPDVPIASRLAKELQGQAHEVRLNLVGGEGPDQSAEIARLIHNSDVWIFVLGRASRLGVDMVKLFSVTEKILSTRSDLVVLPIVQNGVPLPVLLNRFQAYFFDSEKEFNYAELVNYVDRSLRGLMARNSAKIETGDKASPPTYRLSKVLRELNVSMDSILKFLKERGISMERNPNAKITQETYEKLLTGLAEGQLQKDESVPVTGIGKQKLERADQHSIPFNQRQTWLLAFNLGNWGIENIKPGNFAYYNSYRADRQQRVEYENYKKVREGDLVIGYDFKQQKKALCVLRITKPLNDNPRYGEIIEMRVEELFKSPVDLFSFDVLSPFLNGLVDPTAPRLYELAQEMFDTILVDGQTEQTVRALLHAAKAKLHSDDSEPEDQLQYEMYAEAIASIIRESKVSPPPLNIAIIAPWGQGKTTLMRYIRKRFEPTPPKADPFPAAQLKFGALWQWFGSSLKWVQNLKQLFIKGKTDPLLDQLREGIWKPGSLQHPTVWFNPWRYQSSEQIWAGLGHAMITQLVAKLDPIQREQFWLSIRMKRIDTNVIRRDIHKYLLESTLPVLLTGLMVAVLIAVAIVFLGATPFLAGTSIVSALGFVWSLVTNVRDFFDRKLEGKLVKYVREPDYTEKLGLFHEINEDLLKVCTDLINKDYPAIIFIDDLDRCSPKVVTEVIEAINLMMTSDFRDRCYFVFGMDAQMVSAALDAQYSSMAGRFADKEKVHGSVGWYFLDKFIQLPFFIPVLNPVDKEVFLRKFFDEKLNTVKPKEEDFTVKEIIDDANKALQMGEFIESVRKKYEGNLEIIQSEMTRTLMAQSKDSPDIVKEVLNYASYLDGSPRGLKRFANLLRFYHTQQKMRVYFPTSSASGTTATTKSLAKWLVINLRWPQMVRWVQWEYEELLLHSAEPEVKAKHIDGMITQVTSQLPKDGDPYAAWLELLGEKEEEIKKKSLHLKWLRDRDLFFLLYNNNHEDATLEKALQFDVW